MEDSMLIVGALLVLALFALYRHQVNDRRQISTSEFRRRLRKIGVR